jgi:KaiC/GvpD/RAD55 family RecA-like ATPase
MKKVDTGVTGLDTLTFGGIPAGRSTLVVRRSGTEDHSRGPDRL